VRRALRDDPALHPPGGSDTPMGARGSWGDRIRGQ
jgi:hypothetical protein